MTTPASKYYDFYTYNTSNTTHGRGKLGDATKETLATFGSTTGGWNSDYASFPYSAGAWFGRGGSYIDGAYAGVFSFSPDNGTAYSACSARGVLAR